MKISSINLFWPIWMLLGIAFCIWSDFDWRVLLLIFLSGFDVKVKA